MHAHKLVDDHSLCCLLDAKTAGEEHIDAVANRRATAAAATAAATAAAAAATETARVTSPQAAAAAAHKEAELRRAAVAAEKARNEALLVAAIQKEAAVLVKGLPRPSSDTKQWLYDNVPPLRPLLRYTCA